jgi:hypothetical protein
MRTVAAVTEVGSVVAGLVVGVDPEVGAAPNAEMHEPTVTPAIPADTVWSNVVVDE